MNASAETIGFEIKRLGQQTETIWADSCSDEGPAPSRYVFRKKGEVVFQVFGYALENDPQPIFRSDEDQLKLRFSDARQGPT